MLEFTLASVENKANPDSTGVWNDYFPSEEFFFAWAAGFFDELLP